MSVKQLWPGLAFVFSALSMCATGQAADDWVQPDLSEQQTDEVGQVIVQIGGRFCEYYRDEVEGALRRSPAVQDEEFLNDHGTVLVRYQADGARPAQFAESVEQALASGIGCKAWVDRGGQQSTGS